ncbi:hypothetical protein CgunFtcFv8_014863 [Champsocephalus gunnari]|uniref:Uncharacterized protein n=1 Tax=Champsocephalus gunnari TaxID=52237 RepID=A0AAN8E658_CHAGU|nr:hypothetical protein CgunFtcFv8_014863 [Champsocephalus gunnari]
MLAGHLSSKETKFFFFLSHALKPLEDFNVAFQAAQGNVQPCIRRYLGRFLPAHLIADVPRKEIQFQDTSLQFPDEDLIIGDQAQTFLEDNKDELPVPRMLQEGVQHGPAHTYAPSRMVLEAARHCTYNYNKHV